MCQSCKWHFAIQDARFETGILQHIRGLATKKYRVPVLAGCTILERIHHFCQMYKLQRSRACGLRSQLPIRFAHCTRWVGGFNVQQPISKQTLSFPAAVVSLSLLYMNMHLVANAYIYDHIGLNGGSSQHDCHSKSREWHDGGLL